MSNHEKTITYRWKPEYIQNGIRVHLITRELDPDRVGAAPMQETGEGIVYFDFSNEQIFKFLNHLIVHHSRFTAVLLYANMRRQFGTSYITNSVPALSDDIRKLAWTCAKCYLFDQLAFYDAPYVLALSRALGLYSSEYNHAPTYPQSAL